MAEVSENEEQLSAIIVRHYNNGENNLSIRNESRILHLRNFNNWVKSSLIQEAVTILRLSKIHDGKMNVLDLACGKGGDLNKWRNSSCMDYLVAVDISPGSISNCESRYEDMKRRNRYLFDAEFIIADCTKVNINKYFKNTKMQLHLVSCQFAFHYCFESLNQAECMIKNVSEKLLSGGIFIGTIPNAIEIVKRQKQCGKKQFGNSIYNIDFMCDTDTFPIFGAKYNFSLEGVVNCPEFLVYFPVLVKLAKSYGMELIMKMSFAEYFEKHSNLDPYFLSRMLALEVYPPQGGKTMGTKEDYIEAQTFLNDYKFNSVGTLSRSEWDVATLYMVFMFQKI